MNSLYSTALCLRINWKHQVITSAFWRRLNEIFKSTFFLIFCQDSSYYLQKAFSFSNPSLEIATLFPFHVQIFWFYSHIQSLFRAYSGLHSVHICIRVYILGRPLLALRYPGHHPDPPEAICVIQKYFIFIWHFHHKLLLINRAKYFYRPFAFLFIFL